MEPALAIHAVTDVNRSVSKGLSATLEECSVTGFRPQRILLTVAAFHRLIGELMEGGPLQATFNTKDGWRVGDLPIEVRETLSVGAQEYDTLVESDLQRYEAETEWAEDGQWVAPVALDPDSADIANLLTFSSGTSRVSSVFIEGWKMIFLHHHHAKGGIRWKAIRQGGADPDPFHWTVVAVEKHGEYPIAEDVTSDAERAVELHNRAVSRLHPND